MKRNKKWIAVLLMLTVLLAVCGATAEETTDTVIGVWDIEPYDLLVLLGTPEENLEAQKDIIAEMRTTMEFTEDGRLIMAATQQDETMTREFGYSVQGDWMYIDGEPAPYSIADNVLTLFYDYDDADVAYVCMTRQGTKAAVNGIIGVWDMDETTLLHMMAMTSEQFDQFVAENGEVGMSYGFSEDGTIIASITMYGETQEIKRGVYTIDGDRMALDGELCTCVIDGNKLTLTSDTGTMLTFFRQE